MGEFTQAGGYQMYKEEVEMMEKEYTKLPNSQKGPSGETALLTFHKEKVWLWLIINIVGMLLLLQLYNTAIDLNEFTF